jgi:hypothetical protein
MSIDKLIETQSNSKTATVVSCGALRCAAIDFTGEGAVAIDDSPPVAGDGLPSEGAAAGAPPGAPAMLHLLGGGVLTLQTEGKARAFVMLMSRGIPRFAPPENASHKQCGSSFTTFFRLEQQSPSGFVKLLPCSTYVKQLARLSSAGVQSNDGDGAATSAPMAITIRLRKRKRDIASFSAMTVDCCS